MATIRGAATSIVIAVFVIYWLVIIVVDLFTFDGTRDAFEILEGQYPVLFPLASVMVGFYAALAGLSDLRGEVEHPVRGPLVCVGGVCLAVVYLAKLI